MGEPIISAVVGGLVKSIGEKLSTAAYKEIGLIYGAEDELQRLRNTFTAITAVIHDAEQHPAATVLLRSGRNWIQNLTDVAYDLDDVLNLALTEDLKHKVRGRSMLRQKVTGLNIKRRYRLAQQLKSIRSKLDEIQTNQIYTSHNFQQPNLFVHTTTTTTNTELETDHFVNEIDVVGRNEDKEWIISRLISACSSSSQEITQVQVLSIVGLGGMGKTTLAKLVFNDPRLVENFELMMWAYAPNKFDRRSVIDNILQSATTKSFSGSSMEEMKRQLHATLVNKTYLLVLDNVWVEEVMQWAELREILDAGSNGSRVLVTTREDRVASTIGAMATYELKPLSDQHCLSILLKCAFRTGEEEKYPVLEEIAKALVRKCCGVPLVAKTLGSQLRTNRDESSWKRVLESELWKIEQPSDRGILPALKVTYHQMPPHIRLAFSLCSVLRKGQVVSRDYFLMLWMSLAPPLDPRTTTNEDLYDTGNTCFNELVSRSIFQEVHPYHRKIYLRARDTNISQKDFARRLRKSARVLQYEPRYGKVENAQMHDLINDLARYVAAEETTFVSCVQPHVTSRSRHLVWEEEEDLSEREFPPQLLSAKNARLLMMSGIKGRGMTASFLKSLMINLKHLRVLALPHFEFENLPDSVGSLKLLRSLILSGNRKLKGLPDSVCKLVNLQALDVIDCKELEQIPKDLHNWLSLRELFFTSKLVCFGNIRFHGWTSLRQLRIASCMELASLPEQIGTLATLRILRIVTLPRLTSLPNSICHLVALEELRIVECPKLDLRGWEGMHGLRRLQHLQFGLLPLLEHLPDGLQDVNASLRYLIVKECINLKELPGSLEHCTSLEKLTLYMCPSLFALPKPIQAIKSLQVLWIALCDKLHPRCAKETGEDWHLISHIPSVETISLP